MLVSEAQHDLRRAYVGGGVGVVVSGLVWLVATLVQRAQGVGTGFTALFLGGMLIYPVSKLLARTLFRRSNESRGNPFGMAVLEGTVAMIGGLFAAWLFLGTKPELVFPLSAIAVGTHYVLFRTVYGDRSFWLLAAVVTAIGVGDIYLPALRGLTAPLVAAVELGLGLLITLRAIAASKTTAAARASEIGEQARLSRNCSVDRRDYGQRASIDEFAKS